MSHAENFMREAAQIAGNIDSELIDILASELVALRGRHGRLFIIGVGGSAANCTHAVNDFRKICNIEAYAPTDNVSELTAWTNDDSFNVIFKNWLVTSKLSTKDALLVFSVGGGSEKASYNLVLAMETAQKVGARIISIVSRDGGAAKKMSDICIIIPVVAQERITPHAEGWQGVLWHLIVGAIQD